MHYVTAHLNYLIRVTVAEAPKSSGPSSPTKEHSPNGLFVPTMLIYVAQASIDETWKLDMLRL